jgi:putative transposase
VKNQKEEVLSFVAAEKNSGRSVTEILTNLKVSRSSYYRWLKGARKAPIPNNLSPMVRMVTAVELARVDEIKLEFPDMRHRQIQGILQLRGNYVSPTVVYKHLKAQGKVEPYERRQAAWDEPFYEIYRANSMWGADWTQLRIGGVRWYLLNLIDFFSRYVVHFEIVPTVNSGHIRRLYESGLAKDNIPLDWHFKPELRLDRGSPNTARVTQEFFKDIKADLSFARVRRPTDNAITERFYRTIKQEEIYVVGDYQDEKTAKEVIGEYISWYNTKRPHQTLWNFTPHMVHETNNKTELLKVLRELKRKTWTDRKDYWLSNFKK